MIRPPFDIIPPRRNKTPILISIPHSATYIPNDLKSTINASVLTHMDDTDFYVDKLYDFVPDMGITTIRANYSRWVIDLNRNSSDSKLYDDGRLTTSLVPTTDFQGNNLYKSTADLPGQIELERRLNSYYHPYYKKIASVLSEIKEQFGFALLWDAHSIRRYVPKIHRTPFADLILGSNDEQSSRVEIINCALTSLSSGNYQALHNDPFKGGNITRHFGSPMENIHALQLEMSKDIYMHENQTDYDAHKAKSLKRLLQSTFESILTVMGQL